MSRWRGLALDRTGLLLAVRADRFPFFFFFFFSAAKTLLNAVSTVVQRAFQIWLKHSALYCCGMVL